MNKALGGKREKSTLILSTVTSPPSKNFLPSSFPVNASTYIQNFMLLDLLGIEFKLYNMSCISRLVHKNK